MKFYKATWERRSPRILLSQEMIEDLIKPVFPDTQLERYEFIHSGLANTNIRFHLANKSQVFLLRIYTRHPRALDLELDLTKHFQHEIPMPDFLHAGKTQAGYPYAIQRWVPGRPLYQALHTNDVEQLDSLGIELANILSRIAVHGFRQAGFFKENLEIEPFEKESRYHPFISYIEDCLLKENAGKWLGQPLTESLWKFILEHQHFFPPLEPACLVHADFNPDNIIIDEKENKVVAILDWEFAFSGPYLFDIGTLLRFDIPEIFETSFIKAYEIARNIKLPIHWKKMIKIQDLSNLVGLLNSPRPAPNLTKDVKKLIESTLQNF